ncbi:MAG: zinc ABC transporter substrate-binding protein [Chloroflexi bacterium]|nr:zinc ABC transporter substrate-binding protein [Chloroflexota bacterium]
MKRLIFLLLLIVTACAPLASNSDPKTGPVILASTTFLADIAQNAAGDRVHVDSLLPIGVDPHAYQASPSDVAKITESTVLIVNGLEYEHFLEALLENAGGERMLIEASSGLSPREDAEMEHGVDPHMWLDPNRVVTYVENIRDGLIATDPEGADVYKSNAEAYVAQLNDLDAWIVQRVNTVPVEKRLLVTNHEAFGYFAERYGFTIIGTVIPGMSTEAAPSAQQMAALTDQIRSTGALAIFLGEAENPALAQQIADETGVKVVADLYLESLTDGAPAATYIDMMKHNVSRIVDALK